MIFIDAPVGTGFSYATNSEAYEISDTLSATQTHEFLRKVRKFYDHPHTVYLIKCVCDHPIILTPKSHPNRD